MSFLAEVDKSWTLFLDRDGVINHETKGDYVLNWNGFIFHDGVLEAVRFFTETFGRIILVTNQRGVGKGLMTLDDLGNIHTNMLETFNNASARIDKIYYCTDMDNDSINRKPNPGMAHQAKADFEEIDFTKSIMVGNKPSDMWFGRNAGMHTIYVDTTNPETESPHPAIDLRFNNLPAVAIALQQALTKS